MKLNFSCVFVSFLFLFKAQSQDRSLFCNQVDALTKLVATSHFKPKPIDDTMSVSVYKLFLEGIDDNNRFLTEEDLKKLGKDSLLLDDYIQNKSCDFINPYITTLSARIEYSQNVLKQLETETLNYSGKDTIYFYSKDVVKYLRNENDIKRYWNKKIRYEILSKIVEIDSSLNQLQKDFKTLERKIKPQIIQKQICVLNELMNQNGGISEFVEEALLNAYVKYQDPHSTFFNPTDKTIYENYLSNDQLSFGITTDKNNSGEIVVSYISPGSPAFNNGNIEINDVIKSLQSENDTLETYCVSNADVQGFMSNNDHNSVTFTLQKKNGTLAAIELTKTLSKVEDNTIDGYIIGDEERFGYIEIPLFYTDFESPNGLGVANDVAKQIYKLEKDNIDGLILDLRFNAGGSMKEAADLVGMFINKGPLSILKYSDGETFTMRDSNRGTVFNKPLIILTNNYSASASEFFAAAMQDYNRAILVGSSTFGKSTAQVILPLDDAETLGYSKLTVEKFYRVTGESHQGNGVTPDIILPSIYDGFSEKENAKRYALVADTIDITLTPIPYAPLPLEVLRTQNKTRLKVNNQFKTIEKFNHDLVENYINKNIEYTLTLENVFNDHHSYNQIWQSLEKSNDSLKPLCKVKNTRAMDELLKYDLVRQEENQIILEVISKDIYINESKEILHDYIQLLNNY